jgi:hypothetical protein
MRTNRATRILTITCLGVLSASLLLVGCSGSEPEMSQMRENFITQLRADAASDGAPQEQVDCVVDGLSQFSDEQLQGIVDGSPSAEVSSALGLLYEDCTAES